MSVCARRCAPVVSPAYLDTSSGLRSLADARGMDLDAVQAAAASGTLAPIVRGMHTTEDAPASTVAVKRRRLDLMARR